MGWNGVIGFQAHLMALGKSPILVVHHIGGLLMATTMAMTPSVGTDILKLWLYIRIEIFSKPQLQTIVFTVEIEIGYFT